MKNKAKSEEHKEYTGWWLQLSERYFDATITPDEEKALTQFLATEESDIPEFDEIKAVMGFIAAGRRINGNKKRNRKHRFTRWAAAASIALLAIAGITLKSGIASHEEEKEIYLALIDGKEYTDKDFVLHHMHNTMARMSRSTAGNTIEEQLETMFKLTE